MAQGLCRSGRESPLFRLSLLCATIRNAAVDSGGVCSIADALSCRFGFSMGYEICRPAEEGEARRTKKRVLTTKGRLVGVEGDPRGIAWAFIHRQGEKPFSEEMPTRKSVSVFLRNAKDPCIPCTFLCRGCGRGAVRVVLTGLSPYGVDSEVVGEAALDCVQSVIGGRVDEEYAKRGLFWDGYLPASVRHFSGQWLNLAVLDHFHRYSGVLPDFDSRLEPLERRLNPRT